VELSDVSFSFFFFQAEDGIRDDLVTGVQTCALPISRAAGAVVRAAALRGALLPLSVVAPERGEARAAGPHPRSQLRAYGDARAPTARDRDRPRPDAGDRATLADRRLARGRAQPISA